MKVLILNGSDKENNGSKRIHDIIFDEFKSVDKDLKSIFLQDLKITYCVGCFECWIKTPGICRFNDDGRKVSEMFINSDLTVFFTPVTFGGYSSELKRALDRIIGLILPYFQQVNGETHHKLRYKKYPNLLVIGVLPERDKESEVIFKTLVERNAKNLFPPSYASGIFLTKDNENKIRAKTRSMLKDLGAV